MTRGSTEYRKVCLIAVYRNNERYVSVICHLTTAGESVQFGRGLEQICISDEILELVSTVNSLYYVVS